MDQPVLVEQVVGPMFAAWNRGDLESYVSHWSEDADLVNVLGMHHQGRAAILNELRFLHAGLLKGTNIRAAAHDVRWLGNDVAVVHVQWEMTRVPYRPGFCESGVRQGVFTHVIRRIAERWEIVASQNTDVVDPAAVFA